MSTPEGKIKDKVKKLLKEAKVYYHMPVQNGMGAPSLDFICCVHGHFLAIETKASKGVMTLRQEITAAEMRASRATVLVITGEDDEVGFATLRLLLGVK